MNESHEQSYYEIALTNRQVLGVFVVLLVSVVAAFFAGLWIGRQGSVATQAAATEAPPPAAEAQPARRLRFFSDEAPAPPDATPEPVIKDPEPGTTLLQDVAGESAAGARVPAAGEGERSGEEPVTPQAMAGEEGPSPGAGGLVIQVLSSADERQARQLVERLDQGGYPAFLSPVAVGGRTMYRVRVGPFGERAEAEAVASRVRRAYKVDTWITQ